MAVRLPPDQMRCCSLCTSSTVPSPRKWVIFPKKDNAQHIPLTLFPLGICCGAGCQVFTGGPEVVPEGLWAGCSCSIQPCCLHSAGSYNSKVKKHVVGFIRKSEHCVHSLHWEVLHAIEVSLAIVYLLAWLPLPPADSLVTSLLEPGISLVNGERQQIQERMMCFS